MSPPTTTTREGLLHLVLPRMPVECQGLCNVAWAQQKLSSSLHLAQAGIKIHLHSLRTRTRLADGGGGGWVPAGGCSQRPSWVSRATEQNAHPLSPTGLAQAVANPNSGVPPHPHSL